MRNDEFGKYLVVVLLFDLLIDTDLLTLINAFSTIYVLNDACWTNLFMSI